MAKKKIINKAIQYIKILNNEGILIEKAYLYGSAAKEDETYESDIDLMLVSSQFDQNNDLLFGKIWSLTKKVDSRIEPYIIGQKKFENDEISPIIQKVKDQGIELKFSW